MRVLNFALAAALCGGVFLFAGNASAQRLDSTWFLEDDSDPNDNFAEIVIDGTTFFVEGQVDGVGTAGDIVQISYFTDEPTNVNADDKQGRVRQSKFSELNFVILSDEPTRDLDLIVSPEKCAVDGKVQAVKEKGQVTVSCSASNIYSELTADQEASITAAFLENNRVKFKVNNDGSKGSLSIKLKGAAIDED
jgi:hypothetical protein